jgi:8-oxo-dGTP pyrophosphatase MutT (NUDIX family)
MFCNNCGKRGHPFRECADPILSCGLILFRKTTSQFEMLMIRRKDSMSYTEFVRGKYNPHDIAYVRRLLENMTTTEHARLRSETFEDIWNKLWLHNDKNPHEIETAKFKYNLVRQHGLLQNLHSVYVEPEWGFPKGRRLRGEVDLACAEREFMEETNIPCTSYTIIPNVVFSEQFIGTNGIPYEHRYFVAQVSQDINIHQKFTPSQRREISAIGWKSFADCMSVTRPHYTGRYDMLIALRKFIDTLDYGDTK